jgi:Trypsin-co-occurring domain 2
VNSDETDPITFSDLIDHVTAELWDSYKARKQSGRVPLFKLQSLDLEISFVVVGRRTGSAGLDIKIVKAGGEYAHERQAVQRAVLHLSALTSGDDDSELADFGDSLPLRPRMDRPPIADADR